MAAAAAAAAAAAEAPAARPPFNAADRREAGDFRRESPARLARVGAVAGDYFCYYYVYCYYYCFYFYDKDD